MKKNKKDEKFFEKYLEKDEEILYCKKCSAPSILSILLCLFCIIEIILSFLICLFLHEEFSISEQDTKFAVTNKRILIYENKQFRTINIDRLKSADTYEDIGYQKEHNIKKIYLNFKDTNAVIPLNIKLDDYISARDAINKAIENLNK